MSVRKSKWVSCVVLFLLVIHSSQIVYGQEEQRGKIAFQIVSRNPLSPVAVGSRRIVIEAFSFASFV